MKIHLIILLTLLIILILPYNQISAIESIVSKNHSISINEIKDVYRVKEHITVDKQILNNTSWYYFEPPFNILKNEEIIITVDGTLISDHTINNDILKIALNKSNITRSNATIEITYYLPISTLYFKKTLLHNTSVISIILEDTEIFKSTNLIINSTFQVKLSEPTQQTSINLYIIFLIFLLIILIIVTSYYTFIKRKNKKGRTRSHESSELLEIEKTLLLNILKDIEKMHRNQKISDDSYHKLKSYYKQQTVDIMSNLQE